MLKLSDMNQRTFFRCITSTILSIFSFAFCAYSYILTNHTASDDIVDITNDNNKLWIASMGGVVSFDTSLSLLTKYTTAEGLSTNDIRSIASANGIIWCGGFDGNINKFENGRWTSIAPSTYSTVYNQYTYVTSIVADTVSDAIWFGHNVGVSRFKNDDWQTFTPDDGLFDIQEKVTCLAVSENSYVWAAGYGGLAVYNGTNWSIIDSSHHYFDVAYDEIANRLWCLTSNDLGEPKLSMYYDGALSTSIGSHISNPSCLEVDQFGTLYVGTNTGMILYDGLIFTEAASGLHNKQITSMCKAENSKLFLGTASGIALYNSGVFSQRPTENTLRSNRIHGIVSGNSSDMWIATDAGLHKYSSGNWFIYDTADGLPSNTVYSVAVDKANNIWIGTSRGACRLRNNVITPIDTIPQVAVYSIAIDSQQVVWFTAENRGVFKYTGVNWSIIDTTNVLPNVNVDEVTTSKNGTVWLRIDGYGVASLTNNNWQTYDTGAGLSSDRVRNMAAAPDGSMWFYCEGNNIIEYDGANWVQHTYNNINQSLQEIAFSNDGSMWLGTQYHGVTMYSNDVDRNFTVSDGLVSKSIRCIAFSPSGDVWLGSSKNGLSVISNFSENIVSKDYSRYSIPRHFVLSWSNADVLLKLSKNKLACTALGITLHDYKGRIIYKAPIMNRFSHSDSHIIPLSKSSSGAYVVRIISNEFTDAFRLCSTRK